MAIKLHRNIKILALMLLTVLIATAIDWAIHNSSPEFTVPPEYFRNKIIYATIWSLVGLLVLRNQGNVTMKAIWISLFVSVALQTKYFLQGYDLYFVFLFMFLHFLMFLAPMLVIFKNFPELFGKYAR